MTFQEAFDTCERDCWTKYVLMNPELLGENVFLTMSYHVKTENNGPVSGAIDGSKGKYLKMTIYEGGNNFKDDITLPYKVMDPNSEGWEAKIFIGNLSIGEFDVGGVSLTEQDGQITFENKEKLREFIKRAIREDFRLDRVDLDSISDINSYFS